jgi:hypothetical protein
LNSPCHPIEIMRRLDCDCSVTHRTKQTPVRQAEISRSMEVFGRVVCSAAV